MLMIAIGAKSRQKSLDQRMRCPLATAGRASPGINSRCDFRRRHSADRFLDSHLVYPIRNYASRISLPQTRYARFGSPGESK